MDKQSVLERINAELSSDAVPHNTALGLKAIDVGEDYVTVVLPYAEHLVGNPLDGVLHGGPITSMLDATSGLSVFVRMKAGFRIATLDLRIDYLRPATPKRDVLARAECYRVTKRIAFVRAMAYHDDPDSSEKLIASASSTFMIFRDARSPLGSAVEGVS